jgi:NAD(P)-dependent dehydrogenase (short-subunit alcohol dehydrogenase family)
MSLPLFVPPNIDGAVDLGGRSILVVGALGALGSVVARACARRGAQVVLLGRRVPALERLYDEIVGLGAMEPAIYPLDLEGATPKDYEDLALTLERELGGLQGVFLAHAHFRGLRELAHHTPEEWLRALHINLSASALLLQACVPLMRRGEDAAVVAALDDPARVGRAYWGAYGVAKQGLATYLGLLADELEHSSVRVHGVLPPPMRGVLRGRAYVEADAAAACDPERLAPACAWLLSAQAAPWRGQTMDLRAQLAAQ